MTASRILTRFNLLALCLAAAAPGPARAQSVGEPFDPGQALYLPLLGRAANLHDLPPPPTPRPPPLSKNPSVSSTAPRSSWAP